MPFRADTRPEAEILTECIKRRDSAYLLKVGDVWKLFSRYDFDRIRRKIIQECREKKMLRYINIDYHKIRTQDYTDELMIGRRLKDTEADFLAEQKQIAHYRRQKGVEELEEICQNLDDD